MIGVRNHFIQHFPGQFFRPSLSANVPAVLLFHHIAEESKPHSQFLYKTIHPDEVFEFFSWLKVRFDFADYGNLKSWNNISNKIIITIDDGLRENSEILLPILNELDLSAIFFLNNNFINGKNIFDRAYLSAAMVRSANDLELKKELFKVLENNAINSKKTLEDLRDEIFKSDEFTSKLRQSIRNEIGDLGLDSIYMKTEQIKRLLEKRQLIGAHTMNHKNLGKLPELEQSEEIIKSIQDLKARFNLNYSFFAFPFTDQGVSKKAIVEVLNEEPDTKFFGTAGYYRNHDNYLQRLPMDKYSKNLKSVFTNELIYGKLKRYIQGDNR